MLLHVCLPGIASCSSVAGFYPTIERITAKANSIPHRILFRRGKLFFLHFGAWLHLKCYVYSCIRECGHDFYGSSSARLWNF